MPAPIYPHNDQTRSARNRRTGREQQRRAADSTEGIRFDTDNVGGYLKIQTTTDDGDGVASFRVDLGDSLNGELWGPYNSNIPILQVSDNGDETFRIFDPYGTTRDDYILSIEGWGGDVYWKVGNSFEIEAPAVHFYANFRSHLPSAGSTHQVYDSSNALVFEVKADAKIGFFGQTPATQPSTPSTLGDVISALQTLGLVA